jgi:predicted AAA+ superfamily ATPase
MFSTKSVFLLRWFENRILKSTFNEAARADEPAYLLFDEVQNLKDWAPQLKALLDCS